VQRCDRGRRLAATQATLGKLQALLEQSEEELTALAAEGRAQAADQAALDKQTVNVQQKTQARSEARTLGALDPVARFRTSEHCDMCIQTPASQKQDVRCHAEK
jgi:hypothetical protein